MGLKTTFFVMHIPLGEPRQEDDLKFVQNQPTIFFQS
jgi:hypothetical protein